MMFTFEFDHFDWLSQFYSEWRKTPKIVNFQVFCYQVRVCDLGPNLKMTKLLNSYPFIKKRLVNHVYIRIWSSSLTSYSFTKLLISVPFIKKPLVNQVCIWISSFWLTFTVLQWIKKNSKNSQSSSFLLRSGYAIMVTISKWLKLLNSVPFIKKRLLNHVQNIFEFDQDLWLKVHSFTGDWRQTSKLVNFQDFCYGPSIQFRSKFENDYHFINSVPLHQETASEWYLHSNLIILTDFHSFTVNEEKLQK